MQNKRDENHRFYHYNFFPKNRRGQFYFMAAIVVIGLVAGLFVIANYSRSSEKNKVKDLAQDLREEASRVRDYEVYSSDDKLKEFTQNFSSYAGQGIDIIYIVGEIGSIEVYHYVGEVETPYGYSEPGGNIVEVNVLGNDYDFTLKEGKNFYFVMYQQIGGEVYVEKS